MNRGMNEAVAGGALPRFGRGSGLPELIPAQARDLLNLRRLPAMLNMQQAAVILGVGEHDMPALIRAGLLEPLGQPPCNAVKYFAGIQILEMAGDPALTPLLLGLGMDELSVAPSLVPQVKFLVRQLKVSDATALAEFALNCESGREILERSQALARTAAPGLFANT